ncbi:carbohydrate kinase family protein [Actinoplanes rectilineatus]|uniref:carbohydrate kinase family protein n=1 Tax=Actinoplanes rectilineatus TaxID=113571 RepID=UPI0009F965B1|nr:carbohydrate kinase family protein [Actinoplanes rectilineatus]
MTADRPLDLVCFSYLAAANVLTVDAYPRANGGAVVTEIAASLAGDGPLTAVTAANLGLRTAIISNTVGGDPSGTLALAWLDEARVTHQLRPAFDKISPQLTIISDTRTRTWFAALHDAYTGLAHVPLDLLGQARLAYIDCYTVIAGAAERAIRNAGTTPLLLNLGGDTPTPNLIDAANERTVLAVQTSIDEDSVDTAVDVAATLRRRFTTPTVIVTVGRHGAVAVTDDGIVRVPAPTPRAQIRHTHGAGAAFSAGYAHAILSSADLPEALAAGCAAGTRHCTSPAAPIPVRPSAAVPV